MFLMFVVSALRVAHGCRACILLAPHACSCTIAMSTGFVVVLMLDVKGSVCNG